MDRDMTALVALRPNSPTLSSAAVYYLNAVETG